ncbi:uncharacterized protein LOC125522682 [Triticum urartu]|uniref:uncharacterized protein LOC125522682 n=1 Tax=Triticum urartu TaxID=4572 RepID=UPI0020430678|nr:uncharacterized protein LOC125522682 [Triticum urartu]
MAPLAAAVALLPLSTQLFIFLPCAFLSSVGCLRLLCRASVRLFLPSFRGGCWLSVSVVVLHRSLILFVNEFCACHHHLEIALISSSSDLPCCFICSKDHLSLQILRENVMCRG